ncbi:hypothetical protein [Alicyclobacillus mengziensis]|uniref:Uncharacterized protein n=1 Tax=Alicyclobacillus mengziensis TaxID=2931921 RepID=A0A9X7W0T8_9BACL|nr:hypothetical protein [Alicyclobacillus mengziensis]QSO48367.1 hypothetical protein JZ786_05100 [Alicyclobacillus mengziensis]
MKGAEQIIQVLKTRNPLMKLTELGVTPETLKQVIISSFEPFFENSKSLSMNASNYLVSDWINLLRFIADDSSSSNLYRCLNVYRGAKQNDCGACYAIIRDLINLHMETGNRFWSFVFLETNKSDLELYEFSNTVMGEIGRLIEGLIKTQLIELYAMIKVANNKPCDLSNIQTLDLGVLNTNICQESNLTDILYIKNLRLSDWRNIAYHHNYVVQGEFIVCEYGPKIDRKRLSLNRDELSDVLIKCGKIFNLLSLTHKIFFFDNLNDIMGNNDTLSPVVDGRHEIWFLVLASAMMLQGFELVDFETSPEHTKIIVKECREDVDPRERGIHTSQFNYNLWYYSSSRNLSVEYRLRNGSPYLVSRSTSEICEKVGNGEESFEYLARNVVFDFIS